VWFESVGPNETVVCFEPVASNGTVVWFESVGSNETVVWFGFVKKWYGSAVTAATETRVNVTKPPAETRAC